MAARFFLPLLAGLVLAFGAWVAVSAQPPGKKPPVEQEDPKAVKRPPKQVPIEEEEDPNARKLKKPPLVVVEDDPKSEASRPAEASGPVPLPLRDFMKRVAQPHDRFLDKQDRWQNLAPVAQYVGDNPSRIRGVLKAQTLKDDLSADRSQELSPNNMERLQHWEDLVQEEVHNLFDKQLDAQPGSANYVPLPRLIKAAENALEAALQWHEAALKNGQRKGEEWNAVGQRLRAQLLDTRLLPRVNVNKPGDWKEAAALARQVAAKQSEPEERKAIAKYLADHLGRALKRGIYSDSQIVQIAVELRRLNDVLPPDVASGPADDYLRQKAEELTRQARDYEKTGRLQDAHDAVEAAARLWPRLPGLQDTLLRQQQAFQVLHVGVRSLPRYVVPGLACTDSERQAVELVFESLVRPRLDPATGQRYVPDLAMGLPQLVPSGRQFLLRPQLYWSNGNAVTAADVINTVRLLKTPGWPGYNAALADELGDPPTGSDPQRVVLSLRQSTLDPLGLLSFKILPRDLSLENARQFRDAPIGTGPYQFQGIQKTREGTEYARFVANPNYSAREGKEGLPHIREVLFYGSKDPAADLREKKIDLYLDLPATAVKEVEEKVPEATTKLLPAGRRVYFLAVNQQKLHTRLHNASLRRALARAINRDELLNFFRTPKDGARHRILHGPYPADSWAYASQPQPPSTQPDLLYDPIDAKLLLGEAEKPENGGPLGKPLSLVYPDDDPRVKDAMLKLCEQIKKNLGRELVEARAVEPHLLRQIVEGTPLIEGTQTPFDYDLAYYYHDYPSEAYWLWPLFNPSREARTAGGGNFLGYFNDSDLEQQFINAMSQRSFREVKQTTHSIAIVVEKNMPLIPLWQLDRIIAYRRDLLLPADLDPLLLFADIDQWERKGR